MPKRSFNKAAAAASGGRVFAAEVSNNREQEHICKYGKPGSGAEQRGHRGRAPLKKSEIQNEVLIKPQQRLVILSAAKDLPEFYF